MGVVGTPFRTAGRRAASVDTPVLLDYGEPCWVASLFHKTCTTGSSSSAEQLANFTKAIWCFLEALCERSSDGFVVKMFLALTGIASHRLGNVSPAVDSMERWHDWVDSHAEALFGLAKPNLGPLLLASLKHAAFPANSVLVRNALDRSGISRLPELDDAIDAASEVLVDTLPKGRDYFKIVARLRTMTVALIAKTIGYAGPISGWAKKDPFYFYSSADESWWTVDPTEENHASVCYVAELEGSLPSFQDLWPEFNVPTVPNEGFVAGIAAFASLLETRTNGLVQARLHPVIQSEDAEVRRFDFVLFVTGQPSVRSVLFSVNEAQDRSVSVGGWGDEDLILHTIEELNGFLFDVARSEQTRSRVLRLMLAASAV